MIDIFVERRNELLRIAIKENNRLIECYIEEDIKEPQPGEIYKGVVKNVVPAIKSAFVDIGFPKNAYLYLSRRMKKGEEVLVEVVKEELKDKGAKVSESIALPGRLVVLHTHDSSISFSKKLEAEEFKSKLKKELLKPEGVGITVRTKAEEYSIEEIQQEVDTLYKSYLRLKSSYLYSTAPKRLSEDNGVLFRLLRDTTSYNTDKIYINNREDYNLIKDYLQDKANTEIYLYEHRTPLFVNFGIEKELLGLRNSRINLPGGGFIIIEKTEAMYTIDVNTGKNVKGASLEETAFQTNLEAAEEASRQIRLRNLSGIIIIDFIDMDNDFYKKEVLSKLKDGFSTDINKTVIYPFTELCLVQIARRRRGKNIEEYIEEPCSVCGGKGTRLSLRYIEMLISNSVCKITEEINVHNILIELDKCYKDSVEGNVEEFLKKINAGENNVFLKYTDNGESYNVELILFKSQLEELKAYKISGSNQI